MGFLCQMYEGVYKVSGVTRETRFYGNPIPTKKTEGQLQETTSGVYCLQQKQLSQLLAGLRLPVK